MGGMFHSRAAFAGRIRAGSAIHCCTRNSLEYLAQALWNTGLRRRNRTTSWSRGRVGRLKIARYRFATSRSHGHLLPSVRLPRAKVSSKLDAPARKAVAKASASTRFVIVESGGMLQRV